MRLVLINCVLLIGACATAVDSVQVKGELAIGIQRDVLNDRPALRVKITNGSKATLCLRREMMENPYTGQMHIRLRNKRGQAIPLHPSGYLPAPRPGVIRLAPGETTQASYYADSRFKLTGKASGIPEGATAQVRFSYGRCEEALSQEAGSAWEAIY